MESLEVSGKTVEEAIDLALEQLGLSIDEVEVTVLKKGKPGFLGLGAEEATVRVIPLQSGQEEDEVAALAKKTVEELLRLMKLEAKVEPTSPLQATSPEIKSIALEIKGQDLGILIGRRGETLAALQYIVRLIVARHQKTRVPVAIDVEGYKQRRYQVLRDLALRLAQNVKATGRSTTLEPMPADERRVIHLALSVNPDVTTQSIGEGEVRKVAILPRRR
jgi:spoIIIJ-associated protein